MTTVLPHFEVDREGLAKLLERRGKSFAVTELIQNAWDEDVKDVRVYIAAVPGSPRVLIEVSDDSPDGFRDLRDAFTLFAESYKKDNPEKRGRFNLGEKLVLAISETASVETTTGTITWDKRGRKHFPRRKSPSGTSFRAMLRMTRDEMRETIRVVKTLIPPPGVTTTLTGEEDFILPHRESRGTFAATLPTERADSEGYLRPTARATEIEVYEPEHGETPTLYELGIPVVETGDRWHVNVMQKVPLNIDRDNVTPSYLRTVRALVLNHMASALSENDAGEKWIDDALTDDRIEGEAVTRALDLRFGTKRVVWDPSDQEANRIAASQGYTVIPGRALSAAAWDNVRASGAARPAGQVTPSPKPFSPDGKPLETIPPSTWTPDMIRMVTYAKAFGKAVLGHAVKVELVNDAEWGFRATYGSSTGLVLNLASVHYGTATGFAIDFDDLLIHEFAHEYGSHLTAAYDSALSRIGAKALAAVRDRRL